MLTHIERIRQINEKTAKKEFQENQWGKRHCMAWAIPQSGQEKGIISLILAAAQYADAHRERYESGVGEDGFLGDYWANIVGNIRPLLNGELGRLDGGTLDHIISAMLVEEGFNPEDY